MIWFNWALLVQFALLSAGWLFAGNKAQALYWAGALIINLAVTVGMK